MKKLFLRFIGAKLNVMAFVAPRRAGQTGLQFFCRPFRQPVTEKHKAFLNTSLQSSFTFMDLKIQTYRWGNGPRRVLLLHGWQSHTYRWRKYIESFSQDEYSVFAFDAPAHGLSEGSFFTVPIYGDVIEAFIRQVGPMDSIVSHSMGGFASLYAFHRFPAIVPNRFISLASPGEAQEFFDAYKRALSLSDRCSALIVGCFIEMFQKSPGDFSAPLFASTLHIPGLLIHDEDDDDTSVIHSRRIHEAWKNSELLVTKGFGHNLRSERIVQEVLDFIQRPVSHAARVM